VKRIKNIRTVYHSRRYDSCPHDKAICNRRMSNVHAKHDG